MNPAQFAFMDVRLRRIDGGFRVKETETHFIDVMRMTYNWRVCETPKDSPDFYDRSWCYEGTGAGAFLAAVAAVAAWDGHPGTEPCGYLKRATLCGA